MISVLTEKTLSQEIKKLEGYFYNEILQFLDRTGKIEDTSTLLNTITAQNIDNMFTKACRNITLYLEAIINNNFSKVMTNERIDSSIQRKYNNRIVTQDEIYGYLDSAFQNLWQELSSYNYQHQNFIAYHNESGDSAFSAGYGGGAIGGYVGSFFGPVGTLLGSVVGGFLAGSSVDEEYNNNFAAFYSHFQALMNEYDEAFKQLLEYIIPNILSESDNRYEQIRSENQQIILNSKKKINNTIVKTINQLTDGSKPKCANCNNEISHGWKACPECGVSLQKKLHCKKCNMEIQSHWKVCPECSTAVVSTDKKSIINRLFG